MAKKLKRLPIGFSVRPNGSLMYQFTVEGKRCTVYGTTVKECREKESVKREEIREKIYQNGKGLTMEKYLERWLKSRERSVTSATIRTYTKLVRRMMGQQIDQAGTTFGSLKLKELETQNIRDLQTALLDDGLQTRTVNDSISLLKKALTAACNERLISWNPASGVERIKRVEPPARETIHRALTREEVNSFLEAAKESWYYNLYVFLLHTGLRIGEASALSVEDVTNGMINVHKTVTRTEIGYEIAEQTKTEAGKRIIPIRPEAKEAFLRQKEVNAALSKTINLRKPVFTLAKGGIIRPDRVNEDINQICKKAGIEKFCAHAFRATFTSRCVQSGVSTKELMEILGHTDVQMTLGLYAHGDQDRKRELMMAVSI